LKYSVPVPSTVLGKPLAGQGRDDANGLISVVLPFRDAGATIDAAVASLLDGAPEPLEVLAVDDGSTDGGAERVRSWVERDDRVRLIPTARPGLVGALCTGVATARGGLIARMDADDLCHPRRLAKQREALRDRPELGLVGTQVEAVADAGEVGEGLARYVAWQNGLITPGDHRRELFVESPLCHPSVMMRREALEAVGGYRESSGPEDYELWLRFDAAGYAMAKLPEVLLTWRHQAGRATFTSPRYALERFRETKAPFLARRVAESGRARSVVWGAGATGRKLVRQLERHGFRAAAFIDIDPDKIGGIARGAPIHAADALDARTDVVVAAVGARGARDLIRPELDRRGFIEGESYWFAS
jgi:glycosyltransferase involved in cell wall biosynthesis